MRGRVATGVAAVLAIAASVAGCSSAPRSANVAAPSVSPANVAPPVAPNVPSPGQGRSTDSLYPDLGNGGYDVQHYAIAITYDPTTRKLTGTNTITARATHALSRFQLDLRALTAGSVTVNGSPATFAHTGDKLVITPGRPIANGAAFTTKVQYGGSPRPYNDKYNGIQGFTPQQDGAVAIGQPQGAAGWFPVNDRPTDKATYDIAITAPSQLAAISNGVLAGKRVTGQQTTWQWVERAPMASYLALVAIGNYRLTMTTHNGRPVVLAVAASLPREVDAELAQTPSVADFLITQFGPYPFDSIGGVVHLDDRIEALENQARPTYPPEYFEDPADARGVIVHEVAHQWYGDSVSVEDWSDIWLNEGFATYAEWLYSQHIGESTTKETFDELYNDEDFPRDPPGKPTQQSLFGDSVYDRGAATLEALRLTVGAATFSKIIRGWASQHINGNATTSEFIAYANKVSGRSLDGFFREWLFTPGKPPYPKPID